MRKLDDYTEIEALTPDYESQHADEPLDDHAETNKSLEDYQSVKPRPQAMFREASDLILECELGDDIPHEQELNAKSESVKAFRNKYSDMHEDGELYVPEGAIDLKYMPKLAEARLEVDLDGFDPITIYCGQHDADVGMATGIHGEVPPEGNNGIR